MNILTVVYSPSGWFGSPTLWRDASYAFQHRNDVEYVPYGTYTAKHDHGDWVYLGNDKSVVAAKTGINIEDLPVYDYDSYEVNQ